LNCIIFPQTLVKNMICLFGNQKEEGKCQQNFNHGLEVAVKKFRNSMVSHERIYQFIRQDKKEGGMLWTHTRHKLKHRKRPVSGKQVNIKNKVSIELRPAIVDTQERYGDWEIDTIIGENPKGAILTITERKSGFLLMEKMEFGKQADGLAKAAIRMLFAYKNTVHTITSDNGSEFARHELISKKLRDD